MSHHKVALRYVNPPPSHPVLSEAHKKKGGGGRAVWIGGGRGRGGVQSPIILESVKRIEEKEGERGRKEGKLALLLHYDPRRGRKDKTFYTSFTIGPLSCRQKRGKKEKRGNRNVR